MTPIYGVTAFMKFRTSCPHDVGPGNPRLRLQNSVFSSNLQCTAQRPSASATLRFRVHPDNRHHAQVFMIEDVTVIDEVSNVYPTEVHE
jgi:hypothetical protein